MNDSRIAINSATTTSEEFAATLREPTFLVPFLGETIACKTAADAEAVKNRRRPHLTDGTSLVRKAHFHEWHVAARRDVRPTH